MLKWLAFYTLDVFGALECGDVLFVFLLRGRVCTAGVPGWLLMTLCGLLLDSVAASERRLLHRMEL